MGRRQAREIALQVLFQVDVGKVNPEQALIFTMHEFKVNGATGSFARVLVEGTLEHRQKIDDFIRRYATDWDLPRMANVDRNVLRLGLFEMLYFGKTPVNVVIDEALELARTFSHEDSPCFINGILGRIAREIPDNPDRN